MSSVNKVILVGRLGKDPEVRYTSSGKAVANFSLATDESYKDNKGERQKKTEWHNVVVWGVAVENYVQPYLHKGDLIFVEGKLQTRQWEDKQGQKRFTTEVNAFDIKGLNVTRSEGNQGTAAGQSRPGDRNEAPEVSDEDIPF